MTAFCDHQKTSRQTSKAMSGVPDLSSPLSTQQPYPQQQQPAYYAWPQATYTQALDDQARLFYSEAMRYSNNQFPLEYLQTLIRRLAAKDLELQDRENQLAHMFQQSRSYGRPRPYGRGRGGGYVGRGRGRGRGRNGYGSDRRTEYSSYPTHQPSRPDSPRPEAAAPHGTPRGDDREDGEYTEDQQ